MNALVLVCPAQRIGPSNDLGLIQVNKNASGQISSITTQEDTFGQDHLPTTEEVELAKGKNYTIIIIEPEAIPLRRHSFETKERIEHLRTLGVKVLTNFSNLEEELSQYNKVKFVYYPTLGGSVSGGSTSGESLDERPFSVFSALFNMNLGYSERYQFYSPSKSLSKVITSKSNISYFNMFEPKVLADENVEDLGEYYEHYIVMLEALSAYLDCGFLSGDIINPEANQLSWQLNLAVPELCMFVRHFNLYPTVPDQREMYREQFMCNAQYRQIVTLTLAKLMANIIKLNGWARKIKKQVEWETSSVYRSVAKKLITALEK